MQLAGAGAILSSGLMKLAEFDTVRRFVDTAMQGDPSKTVMSGGGCLYRPSHLAQLIKVCMTLCLAPVAPQMLIEESRQSCITPSNCLRFAKAISQKVHVGNCCFSC